MEDVRWFMKKWGFVFFILLVIVIAGSLFVGRRNTEETNSAEEVWEPPIEIMSKETEIEHTEGNTEETTETSSESELWFLPQATDCLISEEEKAQLNSMALSAAEAVMEVYKDVEIEETPYYGSNIKNFSDAQRKETVARLGKAGFVGVAENVNMENYKKVEEFYAMYQKNCDCMVTIFDVQRDGLISAITFVYREGKIQTYYVGIDWEEGGMPVLTDSLVSDIAEIKLTEKGYFIYQHEIIIAHSSLRQYWRIKPLSDKCRELTEKYIAGLSYVNYNMLVVNWNASNVEDILMPCMYEDIYRIYTGKNLWTEDGLIPAEEYEKIMTTCFPVSEDQLREMCGYDVSTNSYPYEMIFASPYPPFGEVVDYTQNNDGTLTLYVDGVWPDYNSDYAFINKVVVLPFSDGTFRYISNTIEQKELELPPVARVEGR